MAQHCECSLISPLSPLPSPHSPPSSGHGTSPCPHLDRRAQPTDAQVIWDGGDTVKCSNWLSRWGINVCTGGNYRKPLPWNCRPPKKNRPPKTTKTVTATATVTTTGVTTVTTTATTTVTADTPAPTDDDPYKDPVCSANYQQTFDDFKPPAGSGPAEHPAVGAAVVDNENYIHYTLASDPADCLAVCDQTEGCVFVSQMSRQTLAILAPSLVLTPTPRSTRTSTTTPSASTTPSTRPTSTRARTTAPAPASTRTPTMAGRATVPPSSTRTAGASRARAVAAKSPKA